MMTAENSGAGDPVFMVRVVKPRTPLEAFEHVECRTESITDGRRRRSASPRAQGDHRGRPDHADQRSGVTVHSRAVLSSPSNRRRITVSTPYSSLESVVKRARSRTLWSAFATA